MCYEILANDMLACRLMELRNKSEDYWRAYK